MKWEEENQATMKCANNGEFDERRRNPNHRKNSEKDKDYRTEKVKSKDNVEWGARSVEVLEETFDWWGQKLNGSLFLFQT